MPEVYEMTTIPPAPLELYLKETMSSLGFEEDKIIPPFQKGYTNYNQQTPTEFIFRKEKSNEGVPTLEFRLTQFPTGWHVILNSNPWNEKYHHHTSSPIKSGEEVLDTIKQYFNEVIKQK